MRLKWGECAFYSSQSRPEVAEKEHHLKPIKAVEDFSNMGVRTREAEAKGEIVDKRAVESSIQVLRNEEFVIRETAAWALGKNRKTSG